MIQLLRKYSVPGASWRWLNFILLMLIGACEQFDPSGTFFISTDKITLESDAVGAYVFTGSIINMGEEQLRHHGFCWSESRVPTVKSAVTDLGERNIKGEFSSYVSRLKSETTYYLRAYANSSNGVFYSKEKSFTTGTPTVPRVSTTPVLHISASSAECGGIVTNEGAASVTSRGVCWSTGPAPTIEGNHTTDGNGTGRFASLITGLELNTEYYVRAYASSSEGTGYGEEISSTTWAKGDFADVNGNVYSSIAIGEQIWMKQNLRTTHYADGSPIPEVTGNMEWDQLQPDDMAYCWYNNDATYAEPYGALYTWAAAMKGAETSDQNPSRVQGVCPEGWHLPSDAEWMELELFLGIDPEEVDSATYSSRGQGVGGKMKEIGNGHWRSPNTGANNLSGFTALPAGYRSSTSAFRSFRSGTTFHTTTEFTNYNVWKRELRFSNSGIYRGYSNKESAYSVRCVKDE